MTRYALLYTTHYLNSLNNNHMCKFHFGFYYWPLCVLHFIHICVGKWLTFKKTYGMYMVCVIYVVNINHSNISSQVHISIATLEIRLHSIIIKGAIIWNYFNTKLGIITVCTNAHSRNIYCTMMLIYSIVFIICLLWCFVCSFYIGIYYSREYNIV